MKAWQGGRPRIAGDCAGVQPPEDSGKVCSKLVMEQGDVSAYLTGRVWSEFDTWVFVRQSAAGWLAIGTAPLDFMATSLAIPWPAQP